VTLWNGSAVAWHEYLGVPANRVVVIPNGVDGRRFPLPSAAERAAARLDLGLESAGSTVLCLGALSPEKRVDLAIRAVSTLDGVSLLVVGEGPERGRLQALAASVGRGKVRLLGATDRPQQAFAAADVVVIPSDTEGQPSVAIEAGLSGLPVVATRVGGLAEVVQDGRSGFLVAPGDHAALAEAIRAALGQPDEMGAAGRRHCLARFDLSHVADAWHQLLDSNLSGLSRPDQFGGSTRKMP
jgi:glycosyltransferase involved in cell wall biosynthesis